jgi:hypothetical protein
MTREWLRTVGIVVGASILASLVTGTVVAPRRAQEQAGAPHAARRDEQLADLLARVERALAREPLVAAPLAAQPAARVPSGPEPALDLARVEALLARVARELDERRLRPVTVSAPERLPRATPLDAVAVADMLALDARDDEAVRRELRLLTPGEMIERFGAPSQAEAANGQSYDMWWSWDEPHPKALSAYFTNGYVLYADCRQP